MPRGSPSEIVFQEQSNPVSIQDGVYHGITFAAIPPIPAASSLISAELLRSLRWSAATDAMMLIVAQLTKHRKMLLNIVKYHETLLKHCDTSWNIVKPCEPLVKHHETLVKYCEASWNTLKTLWNTRTLAIRCNDIGARCGDSSARSVFPAISARSFRRYRRLRSWYCMCEVLNFARLVTGLSPALLRI